MDSLDKNYRRLQRQLIGGSVTLAGVFFLGTVWYHFIEQWRWSEAAYMTVITLSTVGFSEVHPLPERSQLFTIALIAAGLITIGYIVNRLIEAILQGYFQRGIQLRQRKRLIGLLRSHYIICGFGLMGKQICREFQSESIPFIVIDSSPEKLEEATNANYLTLEGDATLDETLMAVKIKEAACLVATLSSDAENLYIILSAKALNPKLRAIARANTEEAVQKLQRGGADAVVSPELTGARRLAATALRPQIMDFVEGILAGRERSFYIEEFLLEPDSSPCVGQTLAETQLLTQSGGLVLAIRRADGNLIGSPAATETLQAGDVLFCMGTAEQLRQMNQILEPNRGASPRTPKESS